MGGAVPCGCDGVGRHRFERFCVGLAGFGSPQGRRRADVGSDPARSATGRRQAGHAATALRGCEISSSVAPERFAWPAPTNARNAGADGHCSQSRRRRNDVPGLAAHSRGTGRLYPDRGPGPLEATAHYRRQNRDGRCSAGRATASGAEHPRQTRRPAREELPAVAATFRTVPRRSGDHSGAGVQWRIRSLRPLPARRCADAPHERLGVEGDPRCGRGWCQRRPALVWARACRADATQPAEVRVSAVVPGRGPGAGRVARGPGGNGLRGTRSTRVADPTVEGRGRRRCPASRWHHADDGRRTAPLCRPSAGTVPVSCRMM